MPTPRFLKFPALDAPAERDGRRQRSQDSRARIVRAMLELAHAGIVQPGAEQVAARAEVGLRTVFRHFKDMDSLYREMTQVIEGELRKVYELPFTQDDWRERLVEMLERRSAIYERIAPFKRASDVHRHGSPFLEADNARMVSIMRAILRRELPPDIAKDPVKFEMLDLLLSFETWHRLRGDQGLTLRRAREALKTALLKLAE